VGVFVMIDIVVASSLSQVLASNYIKEKAAFVAKSACIGGVAYVAVKLADEHINKKNK
jgi:hypothetical protein